MSAAALIVRPPATSGPNCQKVTCHYCGNTVCTHFGCQCHKSDCSRYAPRKSGARNRMTRDALVTV